MFDLKHIYIYEYDHWSGMLASTAFAVQITYHTTLQATPVQLVFGLDMVLNTSLTVDWESIKLHKKIIIDKNNIIEKL